MKRFLSYGDGYSDYRTPGYGPAWHAGCLAGVLCDDACQGTSPARRQWRVETRARAVFFIVLCKIYRRLGWRDCSHRWRSSRPSWWGKLV